MKKAIGFNAGQYGDLIISTAAAKVFKERFPDSELTLGISKNFSEISPLFYNHLYFDNIHIWEGYNNWPSDIDKKYLEFKKYDIVFNAMPQHTRNDWYNYHHFTQEICLSHGFEPTENLQCNLTKWFDTIPGYENYIALSVFPGYGASNGRTFSIEKLNELVDNIHKLGYKTILIGTDKEPKLNNTETTNTTFFNSVKTMLSCKMLITADTAMSWVASAYNFPTIGYYTRNYIDMKIDRICSHIPVNPHGQYISADKITDIPIEKIIELIKNS